MAERLRQGGPVPTGTVANEGTAAGHTLYVSPDELEDLYGLEKVKEGNIRAAMAQIHSVCNRTSIWPETYTERLAIQPDRQQVLLSVLPVLELLRAGGRYTHGQRHTSRTYGSQIDFLLLNGGIGTPPGFIPLLIDEFDLYGATGELWIPSGILLHGWTEIEVEYLAGWTQPPDRLKFAIAEIINTMRAKGVAGRQSYRVGSVSQQFASEGFVSKTARDALQPFIVQVLA